MEYDFLYTDLKAYINPYRDLYIEEFQKTGGTPAATAMGYSDSVAMGYSDGTEMGYSG